MFSMHFRGFTCTNTYVSRHGDIDIQIVVKSSNYNAGLLVTMETSLKNTNRGNQQSEENEWKTETFQCNKTNANIHRNGLFDNYCPVPDFVQDILRKNVEPGFNSVQTDIFLKHVKGIRYSFDPIMIFLRKFAYKLPTVLVVSNDSLRYRSNPYHI